MMPTRAPTRATPARRWLQPLRALGLPALAGLLVWLAAATINWLTDALELSSIDVLLLFAQLVLVPLGMPLLAVRTALGRSLMLLAWYVFRFAAFGLVLSVLLPIGPLSAAAAAPWLVFAGVIGLGGLASFAGSSPRGLLEFARLAAAGAVAGAALIYVLYRAGVPFPSFSDAIVELTAVHYTATGYGAVLVGAMVQQHAEGSGRRAASAALVALLAGLVVTPIGFIAIPALQVVGALLVVSGLIGIVSVTGWLLLRGAVAASARPWLAISAASGIGVAALAATYAVTEAAGSPWPPIPVMAVTHGVLAAIGLLGCGLIGWRLAGRA
jgi:hypothetical protein